MGFNEDFRVRTKKFSLRIIKLFRALNKDEVSKAVARQLLRSGTSVGANFHAAKRARSKKEFISGLSIALEEADESCFWMELLVESNIIAEAKLKPLYDEAIEITKLLASFLRTSKINAKK